METVTAKTQTVNMNPMPAVLPRFAWYAFVFHTLDQQTCEILHIVSQETILNMLGWLRLKIILEVLV